MKKFLIIIALFFLNAFIVNASDVSILAPAVINNDKSFDVTVALDTGGVNINSIDMTVSYPQDILAFKGYKEEGSIKKIWLKPPTESLGAVNFSGIIPGGVEGVYNPDKNGLQPIPIIILIFSPKDYGSGEFTITHSDILQNDGKGTPLVHSINNSSIVVSQTAISKNEESKSEKNAEDLSPPEPFVIEYIRAGFFSKTPPMVIFSTNDKESGVKQYQLLADNNLWKEVVSPLPIPKNILKKDITIRALDFDGNAREAKVQIPGIVSITQLVVIILLGCACYFIYFMIKRKR
jgi:hypothetical protein